MYAQNWRNKVDLLTEVKLQNVLCENKQTNKAQVLGTDSYERVRRMGLEGKRFHTYGSHC